MFTKNHNHHPTCCLLQTAWSSLVCWVSCWLSLEEPVNQSIDWLTVIETFPLQMRRICRLRTLPSCQTICCSSSPISMCPSPRWPIQRWMWKVPWAFPVPSSWWMTSVQSVPIKSPDTTMDCRRVKAAKVRCNEWIREEMNTGKQIEMHQWANEWPSKWMTEQMREWANEWTRKRYERQNEWMGKYMNELN